MTLKHYEQTIDESAREQLCFVRVGLAINSIRRERLYRETHATFTDYCRDRLMMSSSHAYRLGRAATMMINTFGKDVFDVIG